VRTFSAMLFLAIVGTGCGSEGAPTSQVAQPSGNCQGLTGWAYCDRGACFVEPAPIPALCVRETLPEAPSSGLYPICLVSPGGELFAALIGGSKVVEGEGWTSSSYGLVDSSLSQDNEERCRQALETCPVLSPDGGAPPYCSETCG
jgi:hypothetical protein